MHLFELLLAERWLVSTTDILGQGLNIPHSHCWTLVDLPSNLLMCISKTGSQQTTGNTILVFCHLSFHPYLWIGVSYRRDHAFFPPLLVPRVSSQGTDQIYVPRHSTVSPVYAPIPIPLSSIPPQQNHQQWWW
jgi:hypothetical protein